MSPAPGDMIPVPEQVAQTAALALQTRAERGSGGTARGVVIATALTTGFVRPWELDELQSWHADNPGAVHEGVSTLLGGLYGGAPARDWSAPAQPYGPVTAAASDPLKAKLAKLSQTANRTDRQLMLKLHAQATLALEEAIRQIGGKLTGRARTKATKAVVASAIQERRITPAVMAAVGTTEQEVLDKRFDTFGASAAALMAAAERRKLTAAARTLGIDPDILEERYGDEIDRRAEVASGFLVATLGLLARQGLSGHAPVPPTGEFDGPVPFSAVRSAFLISSRGATPPVFNESGPGPAAVEALSARPAGAGDSIIGEILGGEAVETTVTKTWQVGDPERPFEPHQNLDGLTWQGDDVPPEMLADPGEFPFVDVYEPDDHDGCQCFVAEEIEPAALGELIEA